MIPTDFPESNFVFDKPESMSRDDCDALNVFRGHTKDGVPVVISCWKLTQEELDEIIKTGRVWCWHFGQQLQPHCLDGTTPFA